MRLFVAILLDEAVREALRRVQESLRKRCADVRWTPPHQVHLTVKFLGEVADRRVSEVAGAIDRAAKGSSPFTMTVSGTGCFPPRGAARIVWAAAEEPSGAMVACVAAVEEELARLGFAKESRPFAAHLTIGRVREDRSGGAIREAVLKAAYAPVEQNVDRLTLMSSVLSPKGPTYTPVHTAVLGGRGDAGE